MHDLTVRRNIWTSNLPSVEKSALSRVLSRVPGYSTVAERVGTTVAATTQVAKGALEAGVAGAVVGAAQAYMGDTFGFWKNADGTYVLPAVPTAASRLASRTQARCSSPRRSSPPRCAGPATSPSVSTSPPWSRDGR